MREVIYCRRNNECQANIFRPIIKFRQKERALKYTNRHQPQQIYVLPKAQLGRGRIERDRYKEARPNWATRAFSCLRGLMFRLKLLRARNWMLVQFSDQKQYIGLRELDRWQIMPIFQKYLFNECKVFLLTYRNLNLPFLNNVFSSKIKFT